MGNNKFRRVFSDKYPLILIDEYQDTYKPIVDLFIDHFISADTGPKFGFFGDAWQTIYQSNNACGLVEHENIKLIKKGSNFRSASRIVDLLNKLRPDLPQLSAIEGFEGEVIVINCEDYCGLRRIDNPFKGDLPAEELRSRLNYLRGLLEKKFPSDESLKTLMITHRVLASQQGYEKLLEILGNGLRDKEDVFLLFFMNVVEPIYKALSSSNMELLFNTLGISRYPITRKFEKTLWKDLEQKLGIARQQRSRRMNCMDKTKEAFAEYKDVVTVCEVMEMLGLGRVAVYRLLREGIIRTIRVGKKYIIPKQSIIDFISTGESFFRKG